MPKRSRDWNAGLANDLRDKEFARRFIIAALEEDVPLQVVLGKAIRAYGVKEFSAKVKMPSSNILRAIGLRSNPTQETLRRLLKPFGLRLTVAAVGETKKHAA